jgi:hypothetical protein
MKYVAAIFVVLLTAFPGVSQVAPEKKKHTDYYPLKPGTKWTYELDPGNGQKLQVTNQISKIESIDGVALARLETVINGMVAATEHLASTPEGVFRHRSNGIEITPPVCIFKYPWKEGDSWEATPRIGPQQLKMSVRTGRKEEVSLPAGKYTAVTVLVDSDVNGTKIKATCWHAPDVGIVKQHTEIGNAKVELELVKFEAGK